MGKAMILHISCDYDEPDPKTYRGFRIRPASGAPAPFDTHDTVVINTGDPVADYYTAVMVLNKRYGDHCTVMGSSSVDHFAMDGGAGKELGDLTKAEIKHIKARIKEELAKPIPLLDFSGGLFACATRLVECPKCKAEVGDHCWTPSGSLAKTAHMQRTQALNLKYPQAMEHNTIRPSKGPPKCLRPKCRARK